MKGKKVLMAFRIPESLLKIMEKKRKERDMSKPEFIIDSIASKCGFRYEPAKLIKIGRRR